MRLLIVASLLSCVFGAPENYGTRYKTPVCGPRQVFDAGACVNAIVSQDIYIYGAPDAPVTYATPPLVPKPRIDYNVVFVNTPEIPVVDPIIVPPPQKRTLVYVLSNNGEVQQKVIELETAPGLEPEVVFVNYDDGDNPVFAEGITLQQVLAQQGQQGQVIGGAVGAGAAGLGSAGGSGGLGGARVLGGAGGSRGLGSLGGVGVRGYYASRSYRS